MNDTVTVHYKNGTTDSFPNARLSHVTKHDSYWIRFKENDQIKRVQVPRENVSKIHQENPEG